jgi:hypothetical protein
MTVLIVFGQTWQIQGQIEMVTVPMVISY